MYDMFHLLRLYTDYFLLVYGILFYSIILEKLIYVGPLWINKLHMFDTGIQKTLSNTEN